MLESIEFNWLGIIKISIKNQEQLLLPTFEYLSFGTVSERSNEKIYSKARMLILRPKKDLFTQFWAQYEFSLNIENRHF